VPVPLVNGAVCRLHFYPARKTRPSGHVRQGDAFAHALNIAVERWDFFPASTWTRPPSQREERKFASRQRLA